MVFDLVRGDIQKSFLVLKEGGHLVSAVQPVSQEEAATHRVSAMMMRLAPSGDVLGKIGRLLEEGTIRSDVATVCALQDVAKAWKDNVANLPRVHGVSRQWAGSGTRQETRQDRTSRCYDISNRSLRRQSPPARGRSRRWQFDKERYDRPHYPNRE